MKFRIMCFLTSIMISLTMNFSFVSASKVLYSTKQISEKKLLINLKQVDKEEEKKPRIVYYKLKNSKTLTIGYDLVLNNESLSNLEYDLSSSIKPIRIVLRKIGDNKDKVFNDVEDEENDEYIRHLHGLAIINGRPDGNFYPKENISRAEFMVLVLKSLRIEIKPYDLNVFSDIKTHWAKDIMNTAYKKGIIKGFEDNTVRPDAGISLAEACTIISKSYNFKTNSNKYFFKIKKGKWYSSFVEKMFKSGIINEEDKLYKTFSEEAEISREDCTMLISRALSTY